jgi:probable rRNA maturation factor
MTIDVFGADEQAALRVDLPRWVGLARFVLEAEQVRGDVELSLIFVDPPTIADLNRRFLDEDGPTDVLAFPMDDDVTVAGRQPDQGGRGPGAPAEAAEPPQLIGDVVVCPAVAAAQAEVSGRTLDDELALLVVHGVLHLLRYDHDAPDDEAAMRAREQELLRAFRTGAGESG